MEHYLPTPTADQLVEAARLGLGIVIADDGPDRGRYMLYGYGGDPVEPCAVDAGHDLDAALKDMAKLHELAS